MPPGNGKFDQQSSNKIKDTSCSSSKNLTLPKFAASLVCPVGSSPRRNAVVEVDNDGVIISISQGSAAMRETAGVAFYSGILIPGLADLMSGKEGDPLWQYSRGIRIAGAMHFPDGPETTGKLQSPINPYINQINQTGAPPVSTKLESSRNESDSSLPDGRLDNPRKGTYGFELMADRYRWKGMYGEVVDYVVFDGMEHFKRYFSDGGHKGIYHAITDSGELPVLATGGRIDVMGLLFELQEGPAQISFQELLEMASINGAKAAGYEKTAGSLSTGKQPGLCIIEGADIANMRLLKGSRLRRLL